MNIFHVSLVTRLCPLFNLKIPLSDQQYSVLVGISSEPHTQIIFSRLPKILGNPITTERLVPVPRAKLNMCIVHSPFQYPLNCTFQLIQAPMQYLLLRTWTTPSLVTQSTPLLRPPPRQSHPPFPRFNSTQEAMPPLPDKVTRAECISGPEADLCRS